MNRQDALADRIVDLCQQGRIPNRFRVQDVRKHVEGEYAKTHLMTVLPNYAEGGYWVRRGQKARFKRVSQGLYELSSRRSDQGTKLIQRPLTTSGVATADDLGAMRRRLIRVLDHIEKKTASHGEGVGKRVSRLRDAGKIPRNIANWMHTILNARGGTEYEGHQLSQNESNAIKGAWAEILHWGELQGWNPNGKK